MWLNRLVKMPDSEIKSSPSFDCLRDCPDLGHCCKRFVLQHERFDVGRSLKGVRRNLRKYDLPFNPIGLEPTKTGSKTWWFTCPLLGKDGKCGDYENRPDLCRRFVPGNGDELCLIEPEKEKEAGV